MAQHTERDYVLGTHDEEMDRLRIQHEVWRPYVLECWELAGIGAGAKVLDVGAGPGYATADLAQLVGKTGQVIAVERSSRYASAARALSQSRGYTQVQVHELDLMEDALPTDRVDAAWCRWVACFVSSPAKLLAKLTSAIKPGGVAIFHEYVDYTTFRVLPQKKAIDEFVQHVMQSWRESGGEPEIAKELPVLLEQAGFVIRHATPRIFCLRPDDPKWQWPASFINIHPSRLVELGRVNKAWAAEVDREFREIEQGTNSLLMTPMVLEIIAERRAN